MHRQLKSQKTGEEYSLSSVVSDALQAQDIFLSHEIIRPNSRLSAPHFHITTDEIINVLEGTITAVESDHDCQVLVIRKKTEKLDVEF
jgi:uncharacterized cupin superfamily protein